MPQNPYGPFNSDLNTVITLSAAGTGTVHSVQYGNSVMSGIQVRLYLTVAGGTTPTVTLFVEGYDPASGQFYTVGTTTAISVAINTMYVLNVFPGIGSAPSNTTNVNNTLPPFFRVSATIGGTTPALTGTISAALIA